MGVTNRLIVLDVPIALAMTMIVGGMGLIDYLFKYPLFIIRSCFELCEPQGS